MSRFKSNTFVWFCLFVLSGINLAFAAVPATAIEAGKTYVFAGVAFKASQLDVDGSGIGQASLPFLDEIFPVRFEQLRLDEWGNIHSGRIYAAIAPEGFHPQTPAELAEWRTTARLAGAVPRLLDQWAAAQEITLGGHSLWMTGFELNPEGIFTDLAFIAETPEDQLLVFRKEQAPVGGTGLEWCSLELALQGPVNTNDPEFPIKIKGDAQGTQSFVVFDCDGFKAFSLSCEYAFPTPMFKAVQTLDPVKASFTIFGKSFNNFIGTATVDPFTVEGLDGFSFTVKNAVVDYSTDSISTMMKSALGQINYANNTALQSNHADKVWRGFFVENVDISLPGVFKDKNQQNQPFSIGVKNLILDGTITGSVYAKPNIKTPGIEGWAISLDSVILEIVGSSITGDGVRVTGGVNIPITDSTMAYEATFNHGIKFVLNVAGEYRIPFLGDTKMELNNSSSATISVIGGKFVPSAIFNGEFIVKAGKFELPALGFEEFKINDATINSLIEQADKKITAGLDKISFKAFSIGGVRLNANATATTSQTNQATSQTNQANLQGFPVYFNNLGFNKEQYTSYYRLTFTAGINLIGEVDAFKADGTFSIRGEVDFDALTTPKPWDVIKFKDVQMEGFTVDATFGNIKIGGCIAQINNPGNEGFQGGIKLSVELKPQTITVASSAIFGLNFGTDNTKGTEDDFRYFYIDASVEGFEIPIPSTGISFYGFKGGLYYNMEKGSSMSGNYSNTETNGKQYSVPTNISCEASPQGYTPSKNKIGFLAGVVLGVSGDPRPFLADVEFGITFIKDTANGNFGVAQITFKGGAYIMSESLSKRREAAISICADLIFDVNNGHLTGKLGGAIQLLQEPNNKKYLISGGYNDICRQTNISFNFKTNQYYFFLGKPDLNERATLNMDLKILAASAGIYFYFSNIPNDPVLSNIPTLESIFNASGFNGITPPNITKTGQVNGGIAFGMNTVIKGGFDFLFMSASLEALLGFDLSLINQLNTACSFNGWKLNGQAYGGFKGNLDMNVDVGFYKGKINVAKITMAAGLSASFPEEPVYLSGFLKGKYSALNDFISGDFNFKFEAGKQCINNSPGELQITKIPLIKDIWPASGQTIEIYQNPSASFFLPIGNTKFFNIKNGDDTYSEIGIAPNISEMKVVGPGVNALNPELRNNNYVAVSSRSAWLAPNSSYSLKLTLKWDCVSGDCSLIKGNLVLDTTITFKTSAFPSEIKYEMFKYSMPVENQKYWHKGYADAIMEFKQNGFCSFFPKDTMISNKKINFQYFIRLTNQVNKNVRFIPANVPTRCGEIETASIETKSLGNNFKIVSVVSTKRPAEKQIRYESLNSTELEKGHVYKIELIRRLEVDPAMKLAINDEIQANIEKVITNLGDSTNMIIQGYKLSSAKQDSLVSLMNSITQEKVLYKGHYFGVSKFNNLSDKIVTSFANIFQYEGKETADWGLYDNNSTSLFKPRNYKPTINSLINDREFFDYYDCIKMIKNLEPAVNTVLNNRVVKAMYSSESPYAWSIQKGIMIDRLYEPWDPRIDNGGYWGLREKCFPCFNVWGWIGPKWWDFGWTTVCPPCIQIPWWHDYPDGRYVNSPNKIIIENNLPRFVDISDRGYPVGKGEWKTFVNYILDKNHLNANTVFQIRLFGQDINEDQIPGSGSMMFMRDSEKSSGIIEFNEKGGLGSVFTQLLYFSFIDNTPRYMFNNLNLYTYQNRWINFLQRSGYGPSLDGNENSLYKNMFVNLPSWGQLITNYNVNNTSNTVYWVRPSGTPQYISSKHNGSRIQLLFKNKY